MRQQTKWVGLLFVGLFFSINSSAQQLDSSGTDTGVTPVISPALDATPGATSGSVPRLIRFSGVITSQTAHMAQSPAGEKGDARPPVSVGVIFSLYELQEGGNPIWSESQRLGLDDQGRYTVLLGATEPDGLPLDLFTSAKALWLGVQPQLPAAPEQPRVLLVAVPYALKAADADTLGGKPASAFLSVGSLPVVTAGSSTNYSADNSTSITSRKLEALSEPAAATSTTPCPAVTSDGTATANFVAKFTSACNIESTGLFISNGNLGIDTSNPAGRLDVAGNTYIRGILSLPSLGTATSIAGFMSNPLDLQASSFQSSTSAAVPQDFRWLVEPAGNNTATPSATLNLQFGSGTNTPAETGLSINQIGQITFAAGQTFPSVGTVTSVASGAGLTGGPITGSGTLGIAPGGVTNAMLANPFVTVGAGSGLAGGGTATLGGTVTLNVDASKVPLLTVPSNTFTGSIAASSFTGNGAGLTNVAALTATTATNSQNLGGLPPSAYQPAGSYATTGANTFTGNQNVGGNITATGTISGGAASLSGGLTGTTASFSGALSAAGATLPAGGAATPSWGANSNSLDLQASSFQSSTKAAVPQDFRWLVEPAGNNTATPSATLNLQFGSGANAPTETGLSINQMGQISFAAGQTFPSVGTVTSVASGAGLTGGPITGSGTLSIATGGVANTMLANSSLTLNPGTDLTGGGPVPLGGSVNLNLDTTKVPTLGATTNTFAGNVSASTFTGSGSGLTNLNATNLTSGSLPSSALSGTYSLPLTFPNASNSFAGNGSGLTNVNATTLGGLGSSAFAHLGAASTIFAGALTAGSFTGNGAGLTNVNAATAATANNALNFGGLPPGAYQQAGSYATTGANTFTDNQSVSGNVTATGMLAGSSASLSGALTGTTASFSGTLSAAGVVLPTTETATPSSGANSNSLDLQASSFQSSTQTAVAQDFRWLVEPAANNTATPYATLNLQFGSGTNTPAETGLSINQIGQITFAAGQTFPSVGTVTSVASGAGLTGGPITGSGTLGIAPGGVTNAMLANPFVTVGAGSGLAGGGTATLGGTVTLNVDASKVPLLTVPSNTFTGSIAASSFTGNGAGLTNVAALTATTATNSQNLGGLPPSAYQPAGSYATTGANTFTGNQNVGGNITATGTISGGAASLSGGLTGTTASFSGALSGGTVASTGSGTPTVQLGNTGPTWTTGLGAPTSSCTVGSLYSRTDGASGSTLYVCVGPSGTWNASQI